MNKLFLAVFLALSLIACTAQPDVDVETPPLAEGDTCVSCGSGCIPKSLLPMTLCEATTENFDCALVEGACQRVE